MALVLLAVLLFDIMGALIRVLTERYPVQQLSVFRNFFGLVPSLLVLYLDRAWRAAGRPYVIRQWRLALSRGLLVAGAQICFYTGLIYMEFATASTLAFVAPMFVTALSVPLLGERVGPWRWLAVFIGFAGVIVIMRPGSDVFTLAALLPVGAAFGYACASVLIRRIEDGVPTALINLYGTAGALGGSLILMGATSGFEPVETAEDWGLILAMGVIGGSAILLFIKAYRLTRPSNLAPFEYFGIPISFAIGWIAFNEAPFDRLFPGALLIIAGGLLIYWREKRVKGV